MLDTQQPVDPRGYPGYSTGEYPMPADQVGFAFICGTAFGVLVTGILAGLCYLILHSA